MGSKVFSRKIIIQITFEESIFHLNFTLLGYKLNLNEFNLSIMSAQFLPFSALLDDTLQQDTSIIQVRRGLRIKLMENVYQTAGNNLRILNNIAVVEN